MSDQPPPTADGSAGPGDQPPPTGEQPSPRPLLRAPQNERILGGVCAGLARYFGIDPLIVRIATVALAFVGGVTIIAYLAAWLLVPADDGTGRPEPGAAPLRTRTIVGAALVVLAGMTLLGGVGNAWNAWWAVTFGVVPFVLVAGLMAYAGWRLLRGRGEEQPTAARIFGATLLVIAAMAAACVAAVGAAWLTAVGGGAVIAGLVVAIGVAMIVLSFLGRGARWLALPALALAIPAGVVAAADIDMDGSIGQRVRVPATVADIPDEYELGIGELVVDLRRLDWPRNRPVDVRLRVGVGHALVVVPEGTCVQSDAKVGIGHSDVLGADTSGIDVRAAEGTLTGTTAERRLRLTSEMGMGAVEVRYDRDHPRSEWRRERWTGYYDPSLFISDELAREGCGGLPR